MSASLKGRGREREHSVRAIQLNICINVCWLILEGRFKGTESYLYLCLILLKSFATCKVKKSTFVEIHVWVSRAHYFRPHSFLIGSNIPSAPPSFGSRTLLITDPAIKGQTSNKL